ncbi:MAG: YCF48-related protein, partial [Ignavibacteriae bacterium]|nr:YCF48-related protein [Ignavibacteriota bacterium]
MKTRFFVLLYLLTFSTITLSQVNYYYYPMNTGTTNNLYAIGNVSSQLGFAVGANGTLLRTTGTYYGTNFGVNWVTIPLNITNDIKGMLLYISGLYYNYIFGNNGTIFTSTYSGLNWISHNSGTTANLNSASFSIIPDSIIIVYKRIFIVGNNGVIITKCDEPDSTLWWQIPSGTTNNLKCIFFESQLDYPIGDSRVGWISGVNGTLLKTIDGGLHWSPVYTGFNNDFNTIRFLDSNIGFIAGSGGVVLRTTNRGNNWYQVQSSTSQTLNCLCTKYNLSNGSTASVVLAAGQNGTVISSSNSGANWNTEPYTPPENINYIKYLYTLKGNYWLTADNGKIYKRNLDTVYHLNEDVTLEANNIRSHFIYRGIFDQDIRTTNTPGFEWPKGSNKFAIFTAGLSIAAKVNGELREVMGSYKGEFGPGYCVNGDFYKNLYFKIYKVSKSENAQTSWDWANWGQMVPFGAPYIDVNNNNIYEPAIDTPGVRNAKETLFYCMTDASMSTHDPGEGFGGGTQPLGAEVHMTAWAYDSPGLQDVQFVSYDIINKSTSIWNATQIAIISDPDLGDAGDDYLGCDTNLKLGYFYNGDNYDNIYGTNPPAAGFVFLVSPLNRNVTPNKRLGITSFHGFYQTSGPPCETDPNGEPLAAYRMLMGYKKDSTCYLDPTYIPLK